MQRRPHRPGTAAETLGPRAVGGTASQRSLNYAVKATHRGVVVLAARTCGALRNGAPRTLPLARCATLPRRCLSRLVTRNIDGDTATTPSRAQSIGHAPPALEGCPGIMRGQPKQIQSSNQMLGKVLDAGFAPCPCGESIVWRVLACLRAEGSAVGRKRRGGAEAPAATLEGAEAGVVVLLHQGVPARLLLAQDRAHLHLAQAGPPACHKTTLATIVAIVSGHPLPLPIRQASLHSCHEIVPLPDTSPRKLTNPACGRG